MQDVNQESIKKWEIFISIVTAILLFVTLSVISVGCTASPGSQTTASPQTLSTTPASSTTSKTTAAPSSGTTNAITKSGNGVPVTNQNALLGSWAEIEDDNYIGGLTQTRTYSASGSDTYIFLFDRINVTETNGGSTIYTGEWTFNNGTLTMNDNLPSSRPIVYSDLRLKDGILTAIYKDSDLTQILTWQKISN
jgi:hypothetical protein